MKVIKRGGHYIVSDTINGLQVQEKFLVGSKKEAIKKFKEKHKQKEEKWLKKIKALLLI